MKSKLVLTCAVVAILLSLLACSPVSKQVFVEVSCEEFYEHQHITKEVEVPFDGSIILTLCSNPTTGFQWESAEIGDQTILEQLDRKFIPPEAKGVEGAAGKEVWTFKALKEGASTISMEYSRPWEGGEKAEWTFNLTVAVK